MKFYFALCLTLLLGLTGAQAQSEAFPINPIYGNTISQDWGKGSITIGYSEHEARRIQITYHDGTTSDIYDVDKPVKKILRKTKRTLKKSEKGWASSALSFLELHEDQIEGRIHDGIIYVIDDPIYGLRLSPMKLR